LDDTLALRADLQATPHHVLVIGAGFLGAEVASSARALGRKVTLIESASAPMERAVGPVVGAALAEQMRAHGVNLRTNASVADWTADGAGRISGGRLLPWFWSDQFGRKIQMYGSTVGHEAVLMCNDGAGGGTFVALYRRGEHLVAALSVGRGRGLLQYRRLLESGPVPWQTALAARGNAA
jgi:NADPH-dependent 2,4-dienoyl-CoA reductase/sulfur reductase-like enzyme